MSLRRRLIGAVPDRRVAALDVLAGAAIALGQAPLSAWYLAFPALIWAMARMMRPASVAGSFWAGLLVGAGYFGASLNWIVSPFFIDPWVYGWMAPFAVVLMAFGFGLFWGVANAVACRFVLRPLALAAALGAVELLRGYILTGFPWALVGHMWHGVPVLQTVALWGATGLTVVTLALAALPLIGRWWGAGVAAVALVAGMSFGLWHLGQPEPAPRAASLRLVQPNAEQHLKWNPDQARILFQRQLDLTRDGSPADMTIWPETAVPYLLEFSPEVAPIITAASGGNKVAIGIQRVEGDRGWNSLRVLEGEGALTATYDKFHLVPFGEYMPMGDLLQEWFGIGAFAAQVGNGYSAGTGPQVLDLGPELGSVLPLICYEAVFPQIPRGASVRPDWMLQITNDAWFGTLTGPFQHFEQARMRAIEQGLPLIRVANTGVTAVIDARGRVVQALPFGTAGYLDVPSVPGALGVTPYAVWGEGPAIVAILMLFGLSGWRRRPGVA
ncbi:MAG: apolipoprotein N-acyltransferase [Pseudotabrizicola sp.]|uniref:apolipoprotein N-acyltransferase n=2 Tax=Pseudotabrizicola sp. TaxID=2939647 RepID=UPI00272F45BE|nr:apolipoprotein N-acyltransferase [Pseudotabrizicola sp.]MDP2080697.1 apolipoprotein N-acyltransferase [Pseudotabrizicola sp.]MDZ7574717.1 apolipoprotein N-acyltransferase [Pseudotabrizicola sp.]